jgi:hypothetical protein
MDMECWENTEEKQEGSEVKIKFLEDWNPKICYFSREITALVEECVSGMDETMQNKSLLKYI